MNTMTKSPKTTIIEQALLVAALKAFNTNRLPDMLQYKYAFMAENMFRFLRGTCHLFYQDLVTTDIPPSPNTWICGDLHLENFGSFRGNNKQVYFDLNDFDEALLASACWELLRLLTSISIAFKSLNIPVDEAKSMMKLFLTSYAKTLQLGKACYVEPETATGIVYTFLTKAAERKNKEVLKNSTLRIKKLRSINLDLPQYFKLPPDLKQDISDFIGQWLAKNNDGLRDYKVVDAAFRLAGTGSVGLKRYVILLKNTNSNGRKYILLDMKQAVASSLQPYVKITQPVWETEAVRIVAIGQRMQNVASSLLSASIFKAEPFMIQEMQPVKDCIDFNLIKDRYQDVYGVIDDMGMLTASAQLRSSGRQGSAIADELIAFGFDTEWQRELINIALQKAAIVEKDYELFCAAYNDGLFRV
ncbi:MAG: DUF2252 family protein [Chitinophagaceae bacterium]